MEKRQTKRRTKAEIIEILNRLKESGLTVAAFARQEEVPISTLMRQKFSAQNAGAAAIARRLAACYHGFSLDNY